MTDQQKKAVEDAVSKRNIRPLSEIAFKAGVKEVLNNPEKYGLIEISKVLQGLGLKGGESCKL